MAATGRIAILVAIALTGAGPIAPAAEQEAYWPTRDWRRSSPEAQGMDSKVLAEAFDYVRQQKIPIHSLTIVRNGYIVLDAYFWPFQDSLFHDVASVTKSVTSTLVGIAIGRRELQGVSQPVLPTFGLRTIAHRDPRKERMTLEDLLTMSSGLDCHAESGEITLTEMMRSRRWIQFMLDLPMAADPGSRFAYCSGGMHLLSGIITNATGANALDFARRELFEPLGIANVAWPADPQGVTHGWGDLHLQPRDMAKIGYLWLHGGRWENRQIVPADWMEAAKHVHAHPGFSPGQEYGYGFWIYPKRTPPEYEALGRGGQRISIVPARNGIVVFTGGGFEPGDIGQFIGRSIKSDKPLPEDSAGVAILMAAVREAAKPPLRQAVPGSPPLARLISGRNYSLDANPLHLRSIAISFPEGADAQLRLELIDRRDGPRPIGLDGVPRVSPGGRFGLPVAVSGVWETDSTFVLDYDEVGNINNRLLRMTFVNDPVSVEFADRSRGLVIARFRGRATK